MHQQSYHDIFLDTDSNKMCTSKIAKENKSSTSCIVPHRRCQVVVTTINWASNADMIKIIVGYTCPEQLPDSKVHGANLGPTWVLAAPDGPHVGPMLALWTLLSGMLPMSRSGWCGHRYYKWNRNIANGTKVTLIKFQLDQCDNQHVQKINSISFMAHSHFKITAYMHLG